MSESTATEVASPTATSPTDTTSTSSDSEGCDADTEDSVTTDEEIDKLVDAATTTEVAKEGTEKWVNVKSTSTEQNTSSTEATPASS